MNNPHPVRLGSADRKGVRPFQGWPSDGLFYRVGGHTPMTANVRVIAATHQDLEARVKQGVFREDLYHRLNVIRLRLPSLRERREDIPLLTKHFLAKSARDLSVEPKRLSEATLTFLSAQTFPGNVRQLENLCHNLMVMVPGLSIELSDLPPEIRNESAATVASFGSAGDWQAALELEVTAQLKAGKTNIFESLNQQFETALISRALQHTAGRRMEASTLLGIGRNTLTRKVAELKLDVVAVQDDEAA